MRNPDVDFITARNATSIAKWQEKNAQYQTWEFIDVSNANALGSAVVTYGGQPRRSWTLTLDGDRDAATLAASYLELGTVVTCNVDADLNQDGEIVRVEHYLGEGETIQTYVTFLATVAGLPVPSTATAPERPARPTLTPGATTIFAEWVAPADGGAPILYYRLRWREQGTGPWSEMDVTDVRLLITMLDVSTTYQVQVRATNTVGDGPYSLTATTTTTVPTTSRLLFLDGDGVEFVDGTGRVLLLS